jgi:signal transduction histidine kinase/ActR/RegA family two-component response regulator
MVRPGTGKMAKTGSEKKAKRVRREDRALRRHVKTASQSRAKTASKSNRRAKRKAKPASEARTASTSSRVLEAVLAAFAHDVRTPLTGILALSELLATSGLGERERRWVAAIKDAAEHISEVTTLAIEGARVGRIPLQQQVFELPGFVAAVASSLAARAEAKNLACETDIPSDLPEQVTGAPAQLRTALENLIANAVKFTERGRVALKVEATPLARAKLRLTFTIEDSGIGMSAAELKRLFRPFAQANRDVVQKFGGAGLGLVQVQRLARAMNGDLKVASTSGRGSTFRLSVVVDRASPSERAGAPTANGPRGAATDTLRVLCVEDNPFGRVVMNAILTELGHRIDFAGSAETAIEAMAQKDFDVVLMDITLAGIDGFEATQRIRALPGAARQVPVIGISGRSGSTAAAAALTAGMQAYLAKPVSPRALADALARVQRERDAAQGE